MEKQNLGKKQKKFDIPQIVVSCAVLFAFVAFMAIKPDMTLNAVNSSFDWLIKYFGSVLLVFTFAAVIISIFFCISGKYGSIKLGNEEPEYNMFSYIAMMTLAAVASALLYWSFTEWAYYYMTPGIGLEPESIKAAEASLGYAFFHWGISGQAIYVVIALSLSYAYYIRKVPELQTSAVCVEMMGDRLNVTTKTGLGKVIDFVVIFGIVGGLGCSLGLAVPLAGGALTQLFGIEVTFPMQVGIVLFIAAVFTFTSFIGTKKGMKNLSTISVILCGVMLVWIFLTGPTDFIMKNTVNSFGWMLEIFPRASLFTDPVENTGFPEAWTLYFQAFYLNYGAMMGIFITKISKGRTIRQLSIASLIGISVGGWIVFSINGSFSIYSHINGLTDIVSLVNSEVGQSGIYQVLKLLPGGAVFLPALMLIVMVGFVASSLDSASLSLSQTTQPIPEKDGNVNKWLRVFWCIILTLVPLSIMFVKANFTTLKIFSIVVSIPFMVIVIFLFFNFFRWLREDEKAGKLDSIGLKR
jgi:BCCT family betaine/carnitine transporter